MRIKRENDKQKLHKKQLLKQQHYINYSKVNKNENYILYNYTLFIKQVIIIFFTWIMLLIKKTMQIIQNQNK